MQPPVNDVYQFLVSDGGIVHPYTVEKRADSSRILGSNQLLDLGNMNLLLHL